MNRVEQERQYWDEAAHSDNLRNEFICDKNVADDPCVEVIADAIVGALGSPTPQVVEIGCGIGRLTTPLAERFPHATFHGYDISFSILGHAPAAPNVFYEVNDGRNLPIPQGFEVDAVYSMLVFQHIDADGIESYIKEAGRVLRLGGVFVFQFIEGDEAEPFSRHYSMDQIQAWLVDNDLYVTSYKKGQIDQNWTWVKAVKR